YALTFAQLVMPNPAHAVPFLAEWRADFDASMPYGAEQSSLGLLAALGFLLAFVVLAGVLFGRLRPTTGNPDRDARRLLVSQLSGLIVVAFVVSTVGSV